MIGDPGTEGRERPGERSRASVGGIVLRAFLIGSSVGFLITLLYLFLR